MSLDTIRRWSFSALGVLTVISSMVDWTAVARLTAAHPRFARLVAGIVFIAAHLHPSPMDKAKP